MQPITEASNEITDNIDIASPSGKYYIPFYPVQKCCNIIKRATSRENLSSGVCDQLRLKPACSADETS